MFCYQCEMAHNGVGCTANGLCGKDPTTSDLQDVLVAILKGISMYAHRARSYGARDPELDAFVEQALFTTLTNVNFDPDAVARWAERALEMRERARALYENAARKAGEEPEDPGSYATFDFGCEKEAFECVADEVSIDHFKAILGDDRAGLREMIVYGLKGIAAYAHHARVLGFTDERVDGFIHEALNFVSTDEHEMGELLKMALRVGEANLWVMELLDKANTESYGHPEPTEVRITPVKGKAILVSGHDLRDLEALLGQTEGTGINVYTHGEMLPAHAYPRLKRFEHLVGHYGGAWQEQVREFRDFPGAIVVTTNCIQVPSPHYRDRLFTTGPVDVPGAMHITNRNFRPVIEAALREEGFTEDGQDRRITIGFARNSVLSVADKVIEAVKSGAIRHFFLVGGCDGPEPERSYYTELVRRAPEDTVILTLGCGKFRFNTMDLGDIGGIPRLLDMGQCNDAYSAIQVALALADAFGTDVNSLPLTLMLSWLEQKAVSILLTLLHLGIRGIKIGPRLPAFLTPSVLDVLVKEFALAPVSTPAKDLAEALGN